MAYGYSWRREWQSTPVFLPGEFHGQRRLVGYSPWGHKESDMTELLTHTHTHTHTHGYSLSFNFTCLSTLVSLGISFVEGTVDACREGSIHRRHWFPPDLCGFTTVALSQPTGRHYYSSCVVENLSSTH